MKRAIAAEMILAGLGVLTLRADGQMTPPKQPNPVQLELTMEVATTTEDGLPAALRFTLTNVGNFAVDMPIPSIDCHGENGDIRVPSVAWLNGPGTPAGGHGCGGDVYDGPPFRERVKSSWLHLLPGESLTFTGDRRSLVDKAGGPATYEYWAEYEPPSLTPEQRNELERDGYRFPTEKVESAHLSYSQQ